MAALSSLYTRFAAMFIGLTAGGALSRVLRPIFELVEQEAWDGNRNRLLDPNTLAQLVATGLTDIDGVDQEAHRQGYTENRLRALTQLALRTPTLGQAMEARRRNLITDAQYRHALRKAGIEPQYDEAMVGLLRAIPPATDLVRFGVREVFSPALREALDLDAEYPEVLTELGGRLGFSEATMRNYWAAHWELPSYTQLAQMLFRTDMDVPEFRQSLRAIDIAPKWRARFEEIARAIPAMSDMIRFAVREVYNPTLRRALGYEEEFPEEFATQAALHGMRREHAQQYWYAHWRLPSARQGYQMVWRGEMDLPELGDLLKALDYPKLWRQRLFNIAFIVPGRIDLKRMLRHGILTRDQVKAGYRKIGYDETNAEHMTRIAEAEAVGGDAANPFVTTARRRLYTVAHTEYLDESIDEATARRKLTALKLSPEQQTTIIGLWNEEAEIRRRELTPAQIRKAYGATLLTQADALERLQDAGMTPDDAAIFLAAG